MLRPADFQYLLILCFINYYHFSCGAATTKHPSTKFMGINKNTTKIITFKVDGNQATQQCHCTLFYQCTNSDTVEVPPGGITCDDEYVCCKFPIPTSAGFSESPSTESTFNPGSSTAHPHECTCVTTNQCRRSMEDQKPGNGANIPKLPLCTSTTQVCCLLEDVIPESNPELKCSCVPQEQCSKSLEEIIGGFGLIVPKIPSCESSQLCCPSENVIKKVPSPPQSCGMRQYDIQNKIVGASDTLFGEFPWMALLLSVSTSPIPKNEFVCGASLLSSSIFLTAAHCVRNADINLLKVRVGEYDIHTTDVNVERLPHQDRTVSRIIIHPQFNSKVLYNDLALIITTGPFDIDWHINPICASFINTEFDGTNFYDPQSCLATGWGKTGFGENQEHHRVLKKVDLSIIQHYSCQEQLRSTKLGMYFILDPSFMCAEGGIGKDTCEGDGGGPLICTSRSNPLQYIQVGVVSWGIGCGNGTPGVYASLEANKDWLTEQYNTLIIFSSGDLGLARKANSIKPVNLLKSNNKKDSVTEKTQSIYFH